MRRRVMTSLALAALVSWALALALGSRVVAQEDAEVYGSGLIQPRDALRGFGLAR